MKKILMPLVLAVGLGVSTLPTLAQAETTQQEKADHPRIAQAIDDLQAAISYMEAAPHDFGGHKASALQASRQALQQLRAAIKYRAVQDTKKGK
jgi:hypothetical protein